MSYVEILIPDVNQDLNHADNFQWNITVYNCDFY